MRLEVVLKLAVALLAAASNTGCQFAKEKLVSSRSTSAQAPTERPAAIVDYNLVQSASKNIDSALVSSLSNKVDNDEYNFGSANAANYPARTKVTPSPSQANSCASGCSH